MGSKESKPEVVQSAVATTCKPVHSVCDDIQAVVFGDVLGSMIFSYVHVANHFDSSKLTLLINGGSSDVCFQLLTKSKQNLDAEDIMQIVSVCRTCAGVELRMASDQAFVRAIIKTLLGESDVVSASNLQEWMDGTCSRLYMALRNAVSNGLKNAELFILPWNAPQSILSAMEFWFIQSSVPSCYITEDSTFLTLQNVASSAVAWTLLYSSEQHGLSPNRFETKVFNYRSPTILIVELLNNETYCVCVDQEWRQASQRWGQGTCAIYRLNPRVELLEQGGSSIYYNKLRGSPTGLIFGSNAKNPHFTIDMEFSNVHSIEVWGCGNLDTFQAQQNHLQWEKRQVEKQQKIPLPGKWEDSPDRYLLDMAGVKTHHAEK